jgi:8-oxo-dGTP pyrophosphatase MutT (NUDIX family)
MLETYLPTPEEQEFKERMLRFIRENDDCFYRTNLAGHITGSAWVLSPDGTEVLMNHHAFLDMWMQFGGHADGESNIKLVALREAQEESGIEEIEFVSEEIFDIDIHEIPFNAKKGEPAHLHYDIRFLLKAKHKNFVISNESKQLKWMTPEEIKGLNLNRSIMRMVEKVFG